MIDFIDNIKFDGKGLVPVVAQDCRTDEVLMLAYMNAESLAKTLETGTAHYYSRSRQKLWLKGETSGHFQKVRSLAIDCDGDTLLIKVEQTGAACHTGHHSCFYRKSDVDSSMDIDSGNSDNKADSIKTNSSSEFSTSEPSPNAGPTVGPEVFGEVFDVIKDRLIHPKEGSYTNYLFTKGLDKILKKVGEESAEIIIAAKNNDNEEISNEMADLLYHLMVMLAERGMPLEDVYDKLQDRK